MKLQITAFLICGLCLAMLAQDNTPVGNADSPKKASTLYVSEGDILPIPGNYPVVDYPKGLPTPLPEGTVSLSATVNEQG